MLGLAKKSTVEALQAELDTLLAEIGSTDVPAGVERVRAIRKAAEASRAAVSTAVHERITAEESAASSIKQMQDRLDLAQREFADLQRKHEQTLAEYAEQAAKYQDELDAADARYELIRDRTSLKVKQDRALIASLQATVAEKDEALVGRAEALEAARSTFLACKGEVLAWRNNADALQTALDESKAQCLVTEENVRRARQEAREEAIRVAAAHAEELARVRRLPAQV